MILPRSGQLCSWQRLQHNSSTDSTLQPYGSTVHLQFPTHCLCFPYQTVNMNLNPARFTTDVDQQSSPIRSRGYINTELRSSPLPRAELATNSHLFPVEKLACNSEIDSNSGMCIKGIDTIRMVADVIFRFYALRSSFFLNDRVIGRFKSQFFFR